MPIQIVPRLLTGARSAGERLHTSAKKVISTRLERHLSEHRLLDARGGFGGPPFGTFERSRLRWWRDLVIRAQTEEVDGIVLQAWQLERLFWLTNMDDYNWEADTETLRRAKVKTAKQVKKAEEKQSKL